MEVENRPGVLLGDLLPYPANLLHDLNGRGLGVLHQPDELWQRPRQPCRDPFGRRHQTLFHLGRHALTAPDRLREALDQVAQLGGFLGWRLLDQGILVGVAQERQGRAICTRRGLDDVGNEVLLLFLVEVLELADGVGILGRAAVRLQVEVGAIGNTFELAPAHGKAVLQIHAALGIVGEFVFLLLADAQVLLAHAKLQVPVRSLRDPSFVRGLVLAGANEILDLHLLELARAEGEIAGRDFVAESLANLGNAKGQFPAHGIEDIAEIDKDPLSGFRPHVHKAGVVTRIHGADAGAKHEIERARGRQILRTALGADKFFGLDSSVDLGQALGVAPLLRREHVIRARPRLARAAVGHRIGKGRLVTRVLPHQAIHQDGGIKPFHVVAFVHDRAPPGALDVVLQFDAEWSVVPGAAQSAVHR